MTDTKADEMQATDWMALFTLDAPEDRQAILRCQACTWAHDYGTWDEEPTLSDLKATANDHWYNNHAGSKP